MVYLIDDESNKMCCTIFRQIMNEGLYYNIKNIEIVKNVYEKIANVCKLKKFNAFITIYVKFDFFKTVNCVNINEYNIKFRNIINKLIIYSFNFKINENWFIYKYFDSLKNFDNVRFFIER